MRGRTLSKEPACRSICAFCAHRLNDARRPSHVQRRFLQSSSPASNPPATDVALREDDTNRSAPAPTRPAPATSAWGRPGGAFASGASWGRTAAPPKLPIQTVELTGVSTSAPPAPRILKLLPSEQHAKDLLEKRQAEKRRQVLTRTGPGPQSTRAGRPEPISRQGRITKEDVSPYAPWAEDAMGRKREQEDMRTARLEDARNREGGFSVRRVGRELDISSRISRRLSGRNVDLGTQTGRDTPQWDIKPSMYRPMNSGRPGASSHVLGDIDRGQSLGSQNDHQQEMSQWGQLKRRADQPTAPSQSAVPLRPLEQFMAGREQRELNAGANRYIPISLNTSSRRNPSNSTPYPDTGANRDIPAFNNNPNSRSVPLGPFTSSPESVIQSEARKMEEERRLAEEARKREIRGQQEESRGISASYKAISFDSEQGQADDHELDPEVLARREARKAKKKGKKSKYGDAVEEPLKAKDKSKARRRESFIDNDEEAESARDAASERAEAKKQRKLEKEAKKAAAPTLIMLPPYISISNLASALKVRVETFIEKMEELGFEETNQDHVLNGENAGLIAMEYNYEAVIDRGDTEDLKARKPAEDVSILPSRPPVVTIMGHVDHGKTTLLDFLRKSSVAATEHGGITQHIGAFSVPMPSGKLITFLDTPGHAAFLNMRQRGANVTDIVILVVAADDSVKPQTLEAINHAKAAKVPMIVAINKIDKPDTDIGRVKQDLARHGVDVEDFGGDTQAIGVSGKTGQGMQELEEAVVLLSEILDMRAEQDGPAEGWVIEASIKPMGKVATVLVRRGTMRVGDFIVAGNTWARIRCLRNEAGVDIESAGPGTPVEIDGWREQPLAGDEVLQASDEAKAKSVVDYRLEKVELTRLAEDMEAINEARRIIEEKRAAEKEAARLVEEAKEAGEEIVSEPPKVEEKPTGPKDVYFIVKGDVSGSVEAVIDSISVLGNGEVAPKVLRSGVGQVSEFDIEHAAAASGVILSFNTEIEPNIRRLANQSKIQIMDHNIIYRLVDDVRAELSKHLKPLISTKVLGEAEIAAIFEITVKGRQVKAIAGCKVRNGTIARNARYRVHRGDEKVFDGTLASLKNVKKDVQEMKKGTECGIGFENWFEFQVGDLIQAYEIKEEKRYL